MREQMQVEIKQLQRSVGITTVFVTHDQDEALTLSDRIVVMENGRIVQTGSPSEIYERPRSHFVSDFIGMMNALRGTVGAARRVTLPGGQEVPVPTLDAVPGSAIELMLRPEKVLLNPVGQADLTTVAGTVSHIVYMGPVTYLHVAIGGGATMLAMLPNGAGAPPAPPQGAAVTLGWHAGDVVAFAPPKSP